MTDPEKMKKWLEEQEKIKSELSILAGSLKGTRNGAIKGQQDKLKDSLLVEAQLKEVGPSAATPKTPEEEYVHKELKFPVSTEEPHTSKPAPAPPATKTFEISVKANAPAPQKTATVSTVSNASVPHLEQPKQSKKITILAPKTTKVLQPSMPPSGQPSQGLTINSELKDGHEVEINNEIKEIISYVQKKCSKTPDYIDFKNANELITKVQHLQNSQNYLEALKLAKDSQKIVKKIRLKYLRIKKAQNFCRNQLIDLNKNGIDTTDPTNLLVQSESALKNNDFKNARAHIDSCILKLKNLTAG